MDLLGDSNAGLLADVATVARNYALDATQDSNSVHPIIAAIAGTGPSSAPAPSPNSRYGVTTAPANLPQSDGKAGWFERNRVWVIVGVVVVGAVALGVVHIKGIGAAVGK